MRFRANLGESKDHLLHRRSPEGALPNVVSSAGLFQQALGRFTHQFLGARDGWLCPVLIAEGIENTLQASLPSFLR